ncbi:ROK family protein [Schumannella soli]|uniref:ROK family transcriptional regulator n=1 Tax=Schumannella soli TaxID=2590779 RepID=A0A506Y8H3_9MICO|nr:ROK family transcriptional regulator [Schumannella soli]TPW77368.1 ROK family transcriptional regulator [Schumannella soli]
MSISTRPASGPGAASGSAGTAGAAGSGTPASGAGELLRVLRDGTPRTRAELAEQLGVARSTLGLRIDALLDTGLVGPGDDGVSTGGRPPSRIALRPDARVVLAADLGAGHARIALTDLLGVTLAEHSADIRIADGPDAVIAWVADRAEELLAELGRTRDDLLAAGIGVPGPVDHASGRPVSPPIMPGWNDVDVPRLLRERLDVPVFVDNDVNLAALGERTHAHPDVDDLLFVKVATGIGLGLVADGQLRRGAQGTAGDLGHVRVARGAGVRCTCGNEGCLEALAAWPAIAAALAAEGVEVGSAGDLLALVESGDVRAVAAVRQAGRDLGEVLATCVNLINPSVIVIGGSLAQIGEQLLAGVREVVYSRSTPAATAALQITLSQTREHAAVYGASMLAIDAALSPDAVESLVRA